MLVNLSKGEVISRKVEWARGLLRRAVGLMFRGSYDGAMVFPLEGKALFHGFFCRFPILLICVKDGVVVCKKILPPWGVEKVWGDYVVEMDARKAPHVDVGDRVVILEDKGEG